MSRHALVLLAALVLARADGAAQEPQLSAPDEVGVAEQFEVGIVGAGPGRDFLTITAPDELDAVSGTPPLHINGEFGMAKAPDGPITRKVQAPDKPGMYELRYVKFRGGREVLARHRLAVRDVGTTLAVPGRTVAGAWIAVTWKGPGNKGDVISLVPHGHPDDQRLAQTWAYARKESPAPVLLHAPETPGRYEVRYATGLSNQILARAPLEVVAARGKLSAPATAMAGAQVTVTWAGPRAAADRITLAAQADPAANLVSLPVPTGSAGITLDLPESAGPYEIRYRSGEGEAIAATRIDVATAEASLSLPPQVVADSVFELTWKGPGNPRDQVALVRNPAEASSLVARAAVVHGQRLRLRAPRQAGEITACYLTAQSRTCLAPLPLRVTAAPATGSVRVRARADRESTEAPPAAVAVVLDASAHMRAPASVGSKFDAAKRALSALNEQLDRGRDTVVLRVTGGTSGRRCGSQSAVAPAPFDAAVWREAVDGLTAGDGAASGLAQAVQAAASDLAGLPGERSLLIVAGGEDTCDGDVAAAVRALAKLGDDLRLQVVAIGIEDTMFEQALGEAVRSAGGNLVRAGDADSVAAAVADGLRPRFEVVGSGDRVIATGAVGGAAINVPAGTYAIRTVGRGGRRIGEVAVTAGQVAALEFELAPPPTVHAAVQSER